MAVPDSIWICIDPARELDPVLVAMVYVTVPLPVALVVLFAPLWMVIQPADAAADHGLLGDPEMAMVGIGFPEAGSPSADTFKSSVGLRAGAASMAITREPSRMYSLEGLDCADIDAAEHAAISVSLPMIVFESCIDRRACIMAA